MHKILIVARGSLSTTTYTPSRSVFCRLYEPFSYLKENGLLPFQLDTLRVEEINSDNIAQYHAIIFCKHNTLDSIKISRLAHKYGVKIFYDIDDLIHRYTEDSAAFIHMKNLEYVKEHLETADMVVAENETLRKVLINDFNLNNSTVINTGINTDKYFKQAYQPSQSNVLFTNGDNIKLVFFREQFTGIFNDFLVRYPHIEFQVFGDSEDYVKAFSRYQFLGSLPWDEHKKWLAEKQVEFAIVPLGSHEEDPENRLFSDCKTPIKFMEYGALRVPAIYSNAPIYRNVIEDRQTGLLVENSAGAWQAALDEMHRDTKLRQKIADQALEVVKSNHHIQSSAKQWRDLLCDA